MIDRIEVERLAALSRIAITREEAERLGKDIEKIIHYVSEIQEAGIDVEPEPETGVVHNVLREDGAAHEGGMFSERLLGAAPRREGRFVRVKRIL
ncbi:MAG: Asp-tRNA(Asn)/Glu-tRNA(Gln) amidotransferase subunit GatC [bacterium]|nr:Asp-tRNA(Asn)/Glu-tRNA(Gln) amidotransferase subunit GatC [bacterium]MDZ4285246.1 Asp-tRNA(Asn)/Glu-tRNA(Gln) amidotransferase subunit GatC [Patescibacteria group bacterium]